MVEEKLIERELMSEEEFREYISKGNIYLRLINYGIVGKYKSVRRAIRRGRATIEGLIIPKRPFNNRGNSSNRVTHSRKHNELKKSIYGQYRQYQERVGGI